MNIPIEHILAGTAIFLLLSIFASKAAVRFGVPALLLFLGLGMLAGSDGPGGLHFDYPWFTQSIGVLALAFILFSGGLDTPWQHVRPILKPGLILSTLGVIITALSIGWFTSTFFGFTWLEGILLGTIISSTDAAAVFSVLRGQKVNLKGHLQPLLELESGSNDPMAVFLTIGMIELIEHPDQSVISLVPEFLLEMAGGLLIGYAIGRIIIFVINRLRLEYDGLYPVLTVAAVLLTYGAAVMLHGNGFLAVYVAGVVMGQRGFIHKRSLLQFHDGVAWLMQIIMFVTLGLQVFPSRLPSVALTGVSVALFLILIARPLSVFIALAFSEFNWRDKLFVSWVGLRGAAPIVLGTFPLLAGIEKSDSIFHLVFFIVILSVLLQGTLVVRVAKWLGVYDASVQPQSPMNFMLSDGDISNGLFEVTIPEGSAVVGKQILDLHLPEESLMMLIGRTGGMVVPRGDTIIQVGDKVLILANKPMQEQVRQKLESANQDDVPKINGQTS